MSRALHARPGSGVQYLNDELTVEASLFFHKTITLKLKILLICYYSIDVLLAGLAKALRQYK
jgi:hypothetical protein